MNRRDAIRAISGAIAGIAGLGAATSSVEAANNATTLTGVRWQWDIGGIGIVDPGKMRFAPRNGTILPEMVLVPMPDMEPGRAYCPYCDNLPEITLPWQGPDHVAVRLWDDWIIGGDLSALQMPTYVSVDGKRVSLVLEAYAGPFGWALIEHDAYCPRCRIEYTRELLVGNVTMNQPSRDLMVSQMGDSWVRDLETYIKQRSAR